METNRKIARAQEIIRVQCRERRNEVSLVEKNAFPTWILQESLMHFPGILWEYPARSL